MKKIAIVTSVLLAVVFPRPSLGYLMGVTEVVDKCNKDDYAVVYMNGVLNTETDAESAKNELYRTLSYSGLDKFNGNQVVVRKAFNPSHIAGIGDSVTSALQKAFDQAQHTLGLDYDAKEMIMQMHDEVKEGRILFVPHSQGNFYANSIYDWLATREGGLATGSMAMYNVASPAQMSARNARYILSKNDKVIAGLVGAVGSIAPPNVEFPIVGSSKDTLGHNFVDTYLHYGGEQMVQDIKAELATLEVDKGKDASLPCVPDVDAGIAHVALTGLYALLDPAADLARGALVGAAQFASILSGSVFSGSESSPGPALAGTAGLPDLRATTSAPSASFIPDNEFAPEVIPPAAKAVTVPHPRPKVPKAPRIDPDADLKAALLERIALLKRLLKAETKITTQEVASSVIRRSGSLPTARAHALAEASTTPIEQIPEVGWQVEDNLPHSQESAALSPEGRLLITEYYIGKDSEASWVELMNTSDKWIDMRNAEFVDNDLHQQFPLTGIPPKKFVVLKSSGAMAHAILQSEAPYRMITGLSSGVRTSGEFVVLASHTLVDRAPYGPSYCANTYALRRSCERMVTVIPGDNPDYWVRARALETPTQYQNASTIGYENQSWKYSIYEGRRVAGQYPNELIPRGQDAVYVTGIVNIPAGEEWRVDNMPKWVLAIPDAAIFGGAGQTEVHVYGILNIWRTGSIGVNKNFAEYNSEASKPVIETIPYIIVHEGGILVRDPYSYLNAPVIIRGGVVRANTIAARMRLESGKLYLTYYNDGTSPQEIPSCDTRKDHMYILEWFGGKLYQAGVDCGSSLHLSDDPDGATFIGPNDAFGVVGSAYDGDCHMYYSARDVTDCAAYFGLPPDPVDPPPEVLPPPNATTTPPVEEDDTSASSTSDIPGNTETSTSTATTTPPVDGSGTESGATTTASTTPDIPSGGNTGTSTASTTLPVGGDGAGGGTSSTPEIPSDSGSGTSTASTTPSGGGDAGDSSTSTPPVTGGGEVAGTSTASTTPPIGGEENATSTPVDTGSGEVAGTSTASTTLPVGGEGGASSTSTDAGGATTTAPFCYDGPPYYPGITLEELNATCGNGWAPRPTLFPLTAWGWNPMEGRLLITEYYIGGAGEASWFKVSNMMGFATIGLGVTDMFIGDTRVPFPVLSIPARQYVILRSEGTLTQELTTISRNGGVETSLEYVATVLPRIGATGGSVKFSYTDSARLPGRDFEIMNFERGVCPGVLSSIGSCVLTHPYLVGNYEGDAGYVPWSMPDAAPIMSLMIAPVGAKEGDNVEAGSGDGVSPATSHEEAIGGEFSSNTENILLSENQAVTEAGAFSAVESTANKISSDFTETIDNASIGEEDLRSTLMIAPVGTKEGDNVEAGSGDGVSPATSHEEAIGGEFSSNAENILLSENQAVTEAGAFSATENTTSKILCDSSEIIDTDSVGAEDLMSASSHEGATSSKSSSNTENILLSENQAVTEAAAFSAAENAAEKTANAPSDEVSNVPATIAGGETSIVGSTVASEVIGEFHEAMTTLPDMQISQ